MARRRSEPVRRVLILTPSLTAIGGVQTYSCQLIEAASAVLGAQSVKVVSILADPADTAAPPALPVSAKLRFFLAAASSALTFRPNVIIVTHVGIAPVARLLHKVARCSYWLVLHGIEVWDALPPGKLSALRDADAFIVLCRFPLEWASARHSLAPRAIFVLPPYFAIPAAENHLPSRSVSHIVLTVGRLSASERYKGHDLMLEAWPEIVKRVPEANYWIVGDGDDRARLEAKAAQLGIAGSVKFLGSLTGEKLKACYEQCELFAMPAQSAPRASPPRGEGFGIVYVEALAHGKPVLVANNGAPAEFVRDGEFGLQVNPESAREISEGIAALLTNPERARNMGAAGRAWVASELNFERFCERLRGAFDHSSQALL
ncbi:MAG TPA: glycosyltransferase family 4 protein [Candidatus Acidoferrales bacterium]|nr:glycosyltransferase family 4 protein [Candidatus Acidoferrales bacterium]